MSDNLDDIDETIEETDELLDSFDQDDEPDETDTADTEAEGADESDGGVLGGLFGGSDGEETEPSEGEQEYEEGPATLNGEPIGLEEDRAGAAGEALGDAAREKPAGALVRFITGLGSVVPFRQRIMKKLMYRATYKYWKMSGGDALGLRARPNGQIEPTPVKWVDAIRPVEEIDDGSPPKPGWSVKGEERSFGAGSEGRNVDWFGRAPVILLDDDNPERFETLDARVSEALEDPDRVDALFEDATINVTGVIDQRSYNPGGSGGEEAVADGGQPVQDQYDVVFGNIARGRLKDKLIDVSSGPGLDGMRVSWRKVQEQRFEKTSTEEMHNQEVRGYLAGKAGGNHEELVKKLALYFILGFIGVMAVVFLGPQVVGGESIVPSMSLMPPVGGL